MTYKSSARLFTGLTISSTQIEYEMRWYKQHSDQYETNLGKVITPILQKHKVRLYSGS